MSARMEALERRLAELEEKLGQAGGSASQEGEANRAEKIPVVVLASVVASVLDRPHRIHSVNEVPGHSTCPWALHGRIHLHQMRSFGQRSR